MRRFKVFLLLTLLSVCAISAMLRLSFPRMTAAEQVTGALWKPVELPWRFNNLADGRQLAITLAAGQHLPARWTIMPDDELRALWVNDRQVPLDSFSHDQLTDYGNGFQIDLSAFLEPGVNRVVFRIDNHDGTGGLDFRPVLGIGGWTLLMMAFVPFLVGLALLFRLRMSQLAILLAALIPLAAYWAFTPWYTRGHDVTGIEGHIGYVQWVASHLALPAPNAGWTYYHPPLYYILGAAVWKWAALFSLPGPESLQAMSLGMWLVFLTASAGTLRYSLRGRPVLLGVATAALAFWPVGIMHSVRLSNDAALYATTALTMFFFLRWWRGRRNADLWGLAIFTALALLSKTNAIVLLGSAGLLLLWQVHAPGRRGRRYACMQLFGFSAIAGAGLCLSLANNVYYYMKGQLGGWLVSNANMLGSDLRVPVALKYFLPLDIPTFLTAPWMRAYEDATGRAYFWNYLLRSSLSGEFDLPGELQRGIAFAWGAIVLCVLMLCLAESWANIRRLGSRPYRDAPWILVTLLSLASMVALRIQAPYASSNDFRYVLPMLVPVLLWSVRSSALARWLLMAMVPLSFAFFNTL